MTIAYTAFRGRIALRWGTVLSGRVTRAASVFESRGYRDSTNVALRRSVDGIGTARAKARGSEHINGKCSSKTRCSAAMYGTGILPVCSSRRARRSQFHAFYKNS